MDIFSHVFAVISPHYHYNTVFAESTSVCDFIHHPKQGYVGLIPPQIKVNIIQ